VQLRPPDIFGFFAFDADASGFGLGLPRDNTAAQILHFTLQSSVPGMMLNNFHTGAGMMN
jgi:hypothetical protein